jgi:hypothetical protein
LGVLRVAFSSEKLATNLGIPITTFRFSNSQEQLVEIRKVLCYGWFYYSIKTANWKLQLKDECMGQNLRGFQMQVSFSILRITLPFQD